VHIADDHVRAPYFLFRESSLKEPHMMILRSTPPSPFGRKVKLAASLLGLSEQIKIVPADTNDDNEPLRRQNPVGKIPTLVLEDGSTLFDSRVILEYLDHLAGGGKIIPNEPKARFAALRMQALADGMTDAQILVVYESRWRPPEIHFKKWVDYQAGKISRGLAGLEAEPPALDKIPNVGQIAVACFLGHRDLRFAGDWRATHPKLVAWLDRFAAQVPAFAATKVTA
jgi:glutathione S-transferase